MKNNELLDAVGGISAEYVMEAAENKPAVKRSFWRIAAPAAACLCLALGGLAVYHAIAAKSPAGENSPSALVDITAMPQTAEENTGFNSAAQPADTQSPSQQHGAFLPNNATLDPAKAVTMIQSFGEAVYPEHPYIAEGDHCLSPSLRAAMEAYGSKNAYGTDILYRVVLEPYKGMGQFSPEDPGMKSEIERLIAKGYTLAVEKIGPIDDQTGEDTVTMLTLHATYDQLANFDPGTEFGYYILLYDEATEIPSGEQNGYNKYFGGQN